MAVITRTACKKLGNLGNLGSALETRRARHTVFKNPLTIQFIIRAQVSRSERYPRFPRFPISGGVFDREQAALMIRVVAEHEDLTGDVDGRVSDRLEAPRHRCRRYPPHRFARRGFQRTEEIGFLIAVAIGVFRHVARRAAIRPSGAMRSTAGLHE